MSQIWRQDLDSPQLDFFSVRFFTFLTQCSMVGCVLPFLIFAQTPDFHSKCPSVYVQFVRFMTFSFDFVQSLFLWNLIWKVFLSMHSYGNFEFTKLQMVSFVSSFTFCPELWKGKFTKQMTTMTTQPSFSATWFLYHKILYKHAHEQILKSTTCPIPGRKYCDE